MKVWLIPITGAIEFTPSIEFRAPIVFRFDLCFDPGSRFARPGEVFVTSPLGVQPRILGQLSVELSEAFPFHRMRAGKG